MNNNRQRIRCMKCLSHGVFVTRKEWIEYRDRGYTYSYECTDCGEKMNLEWEDY